MVFELFPTWLNCGLLSLIWVAALFYLGQSKCAFVRLACALLTVAGAIGFGFYYGLYYGCLS